MIKQHSLHNPVEVHFRAEAQYRKLFSPEDITDILVATSRSIRRYPAELQVHLLEPEEQVIEMGAGLGGYIPYIAERQADHKGLKPIVIDPIDYNQARELLEHGLKEKLDDRARRNIEYMIERCTILADSSKVVHVQASFPQALRDNPQLQGTADIVIDQFGSTSYVDINDPIFNPDDEQLTQKAVQAQIKKLFKPKVAFDENFYSNADYLSLLVG